MKKRILSLVLCAAMLLSMCLFLGAGVLDDASDAPAESTAAAESTATSPAVGPILPLVVTRPQTSLYRAARAPSLADANETPLDDGLKLEKTVTPNANGGYTVHLEAYTTGTVTTTTTTKPCDIVLVLDQSGSMADDFDGNKTNTNSDRRQYAMKEAVNVFIAAVGEKYDAAKSDHRIAIVTFGSNASQLLGWTFADEAGQTALMEMVDGLPTSPSGATNVGAGMQQAQGLMSDGSYAGTNTDRQKVVVLFTDGVPTTQSDFDTGVANNAITAAKTMKDSGVTVYSVGIFTGANPEQTYGDSGFNNNSNGTVNSYWANRNGWFTGGDIDACDVPAGNRFLNYVSSNYKTPDQIGLSTYSDWHFGYSLDGWKITKNFDRTANGYYLTANDSASLKNIFTSISQTIGSSNIDLGSNTVIKDIVTPYFTLPQNAGDIRLYTADYDGSTFGAQQSIGSPVTATIDPTTRAVNVTGFDFNQYYISTNAKADGTHGKKLIIEFDVSVADGFLGGNQVPTNDGQSGIYAKGTMIKAFDVPTQDVEVKSITPMADPETIYLGDSANLQELVHQNATFDGTNNAFVDVTYTVEDENGGTVGTYTVPAGSSSGTWVWSDAASGGTVAPEQTTTYKVTCTVSPTQSGKYERVSKDATFTITVKTCSLTINKTVTGDGVNPNQTFVFNVKDKDGKLVTTVVLKGNTSTTITGLAVGDYTVVEDTAWSWSYELVDEGNASATLNKDNPNGEVKVTNSVKGTNWLTSIADVINKWTTKDGKTTINNSDRVPGAN